MTENNWKKDHPSTLDRIAKAMHKTFDEILHEALPESWTDLLNRLNAEEDAQPKNE